MKKVKFIAIIASLVLFFNYCTPSENENSGTDGEATTETVEETPEKAALVDAPFENRTVAYSSHQVKTTESQTISFDSGTEIFVPAGAFVDANGEPVEDVTIKYREFLSLSDIMTSGITMMYDSAGKSYPFQTAGMFELRGVDSNGTPVFIEDGKEVTVSMASFDGGDFNFYRLDEEEGTGWEHLAESQVEPMPQEYAAPASKPVKPIAYDPNSDHVFQLEVDYSDFPELRAFRGLMWKYAGDEAEWTEASKALSQTWHHSSIEVENPDEGTYLLSLSRENTDETASFSVAPVLAGENLERAQAEFDRRMNTYQAQEADMSFRRVASVNNFGFYNCDRIFRSPNAVLCDISFEVGDGLGLAKLYHVIPNQNVIVSVYGDQFKRTLNPDDNNVFVAITDDQRIAVSKSTDFTRLFNTAEQTGHFVLQPVTDAPVDEQTDLGSLFRNI